MKQPAVQMNQSEESHVNVLAPILSFISFIQDANLSTMPVIYMVALIYKLVFYHEIVLWTKWGDFHEKTTEQYWKQIWKKVNTNFKVQR
jgi:hypothetical protein